MTEYEPGPIQEVKVISEGILEDWPAKQEKDLAWVYVSLMGERFCEAVTVILNGEDHNKKLKHSYFYKLQQIVIQLNFQYNDYLRYYRFNPYMRFNNEASYCLL